MNYAVWGIFISLLIILSIIDWKTYMLPDGLTQTLLWLGLAFNSYAFHVSSRQAIWGAICGYGLLWIINAFYRLCRAQNGIGQGDFKLLAAIGAWLGVLALPWVVCIASVSGLCAAIVLWFRHRQTVCPFGPFLALGAVGVLVFQLCLQ
ncbi:MAG: hypothetical protein DHS20C10_03690 [marine bacterium B5-7]|nr:MAG: hypothetical protein DHS20C10_03690 [marine bacterium B5-7]